MWLSELAFLTPHSIGGCSMNIVPISALLILEKALENLQSRANSRGECYGGEILDCMKEAGTALAVDALELQLTRTILVRTMESLGENYPAGVLQNYDHRMPLSEALTYLREAIAWTRRRQLNNAERGLRQCSLKEAERS